MVTEDEHAFLCETDKERWDSEFGGVKFDLKLGERTIVVIGVCVELRLDDVDGEVSGVYLKGDAVVGLDTLNSLLDIRGSSNWFSR